MATALRLRRGTTAQHGSFTGLEGEVTVDTTKDTLVVHDGSTSGGFPLLKEAAIGTSVQAYDADTAKTDVAQTFTAAQTFRAASAIRSEAAATQDAVVIAGRAGGTSSYEVTITPTTLSADRTLTLPDVTTTVTGTDATQTLTNKRVTPRVSTTTSSATPTINTDNVDIYGLTAQTVDITSFTTNLSGTPTDGQKLQIYIVGTAARAITWGASFEASTVALPTTTVSTNRLDVGFVWNAATSKWRCVATA